MGVRPRWRPRIPRRAQGGAAEGGHYAGCKSAAYLSQSARPLDRSTLIDSMRPYPTATQPQFKINHKSGGRGKCAAHGEGETPAGGGKPSAADLPPSELERKAPRSVWATQLPASRPIRWIVRESREANRTDFARIPSDGLRDAPRASTDGLARIRKADADSTISQPRYGRNQPPLNHEPTILRVESKNDSDTTIPHP